MANHDFHTPISIQQLLNAPTVVDLSTAARALGIGRTLAYQLVRDNRFPVPVLRVGRQYRVPSATLLAALGLGHQTADAAWKPHHSQVTIEGSKYRLDGLDVVNGCG